MEKEVYCCRQCGSMYLSDKGQTGKCGQCGGNLADTRISESTWKELSDTQKTYVINSIKENPEVKSHSGFEPMDYRIDESQSNVKDTYAWLLAIVPLLCTLIFDWKSRTVGTGMEIGIFLMFLFLVLDFKVLEKVGQNKFWAVFGIFCTPVYLFIRARKTNRKYGYLVAYIVLLALCIIAFRRPSIEKGSMDEKERIESLENETSSEAGSSMEEIESGCTEAEESDTVAPKENSADSSDKSDSTTEMEEDEEWQEQYDDAYQKGKDLAEKLNDIFSRQ